MGRKPITKIGSPLSGTGRPQVVKRDVQPAQTTTVTVKRDPPDDIQNTEDQAWWDGLSGYVSSATSYFSGSDTSGGEPPMPQEVAYFLPLLIMPPSQFKIEAAKHSKTMDNLSPEKKAAMKIAVRNIRANLDYVAGQPPKVYVMAAIIALLTGFIVYKYVK